MSISGAGPHRFADRLNQRLIEADHQSVQADMAMQAVETTVPPRIAIVSLLFNWPSTGGGTVHTAEAAFFLKQAGYEVHHIYAVCDAHGIGQVTEPSPLAGTPVHFAASDFHAQGILDRFREALADVSPDFVIVTDSWNTKVLLAEAASAYPYFLRLAALECICPLNNVRLLFQNGQFTQCHRNQLALPTVCHECVQRNEQYSGDMHRLDRHLAEFKAPDYPERLRAAFENAAGVLAVNPLIATLVEPFCRRVDVVPSGFDPSRFANLGDCPDSGTIRILFAGLIEEPMKGFAVLHDAYRQLVSDQLPVELVVTAEDVFTHISGVHAAGWQTQETLPALMASCDIVVVPTVAQDALGRTAVEAMGAGRAVVASRIGGLSYTVIDEVTGLLFEPGSAGDLADKLRTLATNRELRQNLGANGRRRFAEHYTWDVIIERHYRRLFTPEVARRQLN